MYKLASENLVFKDMNFFPVIMNRPLRNLTQKFMMKYIFALILLQAWGHQGKMV
jgi:hypothetical protein